MLLVLGSLNSKHFSCSFVHPVGIACLTNRFVDVFAGGVMWDALDDMIVLGVLVRLISMLLLLESLSIFLGCA